MIKKGYILVLVVLLSIFLFYASAAVADSAAYYSSPFTSINVTFSGDYDSYLDWTTPIEWNITYKNVTTNIPITNQTAECYVNLSGTRVNATYSIPLQQFEVTVAYSGPVTNAYYQVHCIDLLNAQNSIDLRDGSSVLELNIFNVTNPYIVTAVNQSNFNSSLDREFETLPTKLYVGLHNVTGLTDEYVNSQSCIFNFNNSPLALVYPSTIQNYSSASIIYNSTGSVPYSANCSINGFVYNSTENFLYLESRIPLFVNSGKTMSGSANRQAGILYYQNAESFAAITENQNSANNLSIYNLSGTGKVFTTNGNFTSSTLILISYAKNIFYDIIHTGFNYFSLNLFRYSSQSFTNLAFNISDYRLASITSSDYNRDSNYDFVMSGEQHFGSIDFTMNTTVFDDNLTPKGYLPQYSNSSICTLDVNNDGFDDILLAGSNNSGVTNSTIYSFNSATHKFEFYAYLPIKASDGSCAVGNFLNSTDPDLIIFGKNSSAPNPTSANLSYLIIDNFTTLASANSQFTLPDFIPLVKSNIITADFDNDGYSDIIVCGEYGAQIRRLNYFKNSLHINGTFTKKDILPGAYGVSDCSLSALDYDVDGDLDLLLIGNNGSSIPNRPLVLFNNTLSTYVANQPPSAPTEINASYNSQAQTLQINWTSGSDDRTPSDKLAYNVEVIDTQTNNIILSGLYPLTTHPAQGYWGNMRYRHNVTLYNITSANLNVSVQTIDTGLRQSSYRSRLISPAACSVPSSGEWLINQSCTLSEIIANPITINITTGGNLVILSSVSLPAFTNISISNGTLQLASATYLNGSYSYLTLESNATLFANNTYLNNFTINSSMAFNVSGVVFGNTTLILKNTSDFRNSFISNLSINTTLPVFLLNTTVSNSSAHQNTFDKSFFTLSAVNSSGSTISSFTVSSLITYSTLMNTTFTIRNLSGNYSLNYSFNISKPYYYTNQTNISAGGNYLLTLYNAPEPFVNGFNTTNFTALLTGNYTADEIILSNVSNVTISRSGIGSLYYLVPINVSGLNLSSLIIISPNSVFVDDSAVQNLNRTAQVNMSGLAYSKIPAILKNGEICSTCSNIVYSGDALSFTTTSFSNFTTVNNSQIVLHSSRVGFVNEITNINITFENFSNSNELITSSCYFSTNYTGQDLNQTMQHISGIGYNASINVTSVATINATVACAQVGDYEAANYTFTLSIVPSGTYFILRDTYSQIRDSRIARGDLNGTSNVSLIQSGPFSATGSATTLKIYSGNTQEETGLTKVFSSTIISDSPNSTIFLGSSYLTSFLTKISLNGETFADFYSMYRDQILAIDYDSDGDQDIILCGLNTSNSAQTVLLKNNYAQSSFERLFAQNFSYSSEVLYNSKYCALSKLNSNNFTNSMIVISGQDSSGNFLQSLFLSNGTNYSQYSSLNNATYAALYPNSIYAFYYNNVSYLLTWGDPGTGINQFFMFEYNGSTFILNETLTNQLPDSRQFATFTAGDVDNSGKYTFIISLYNSSTTTGPSSAAGSQIYALKFNGTNFTQLNIASSVTPILSGSMLLYDSDNDGDLDLLVSGSTSGTSAITHLYENTASESQTFTQPSPPVINVTSYDSTTSRFFANWTGNYSNTYNIRVGNTSSPNAFVTGYITSASNPIQSYIGNTGWRQNATYYLPDACFAVQVQTIDMAYRQSAWSSVIVNNHTEYCDGYDNNCDGVIDETFDVDGDGYFNYSIQTSNASAKCSFYDYNTAAYDCDDNSTSMKGPGNICWTSPMTYWVWDSSAKKCTCSPVSTTVAVPDSGTGGSSTSAAAVPITRVVTEPEKTTETKVTEQVTPPPADIPSQAPATAYDTSGSTKAALEIDVEYRDGRTFVTELVRNKQRTTVDEMTVRKIFPKDVLASASELKSVTPFIIIEEDPVIDFNLGKMGYLESKQLVYSIPGAVDSAVIEKLSTQFFTQQELSEAQIAQVEAKQEAKAATALNITQSEQIIGNQTQITIDLNLTENVTSVQGVEIEQFIPKCLLHEITQTVLEAGVDKSLLNSVRIKEADPIIVWNLQEISDATKLTLKIDGLRPEDCDDEIKIKTLAREYIKANYEINPLNLTKSVLLTVGIFVLFIFLYLISNYLKAENEDPKVHEIVRKILKRYHAGISLEKVRAELITDKVELSLVDTAMSHIRSERLEKRHKFWHAAIENGIQIFIFTTALVLNSMEFFGFLPGYLDWIKKVLSWVLIILLLYDANLTKIVFNNSKKWLNITLLMGMFCMYLKSLVIYAKTKSLDENTYFIFDLYAFVLNHNHFFTQTLFFIGAGLILVASIAMAWGLQVKEGCLYFTFTHHPNAHTLWQKIKRSGKLFAIFMFFGFSIFNRVVEWLGVAIDTTVFMIVLVVLLFILASTSFVHNHKAFKLHIVEVIARIFTVNSIWILFVSIFLFAFAKPFLSPIISQGILGMFGALILIIALYTLRSGVKDHFAGLQKMSAVVDEATTKFIKLFSHPSTIFLGISGLFLLQHIVEIALYIIPNITGQADSDYSQYAVNTLLGLFSNQSIIAVHLFTLDIFSRFVVGSIYAISILGGLFLFMVPLVVWVLYFMRRHTHPSQISIRDLFLDKTNSFYKLCQFILVFAVPSILVSIATKVLSISYASNLSDASYVGIIISAQKLTLTPGACFFILIGYILYIQISAALLRASITNPKKYDQTSRALVSLTIIISFTSLFLLYVIPYVLSIVAYIHTLLSSAAGASTWVMTLYWVLVVQFWFDIIMVYLCGSLILIFFGLPRNIKMLVIGGLSHIPFFHHLFFLASSLSHIDYYVDASEKYSGNILAHVKNYLQTLEADGHHLETIVYQLKVHGYPQEIINTAIEQLVRDKKFIHTLEHIKAEHISVHQVKKLITLIKAEFAKKTTPQEIYELFMDRFSHAEIKLALLYVSGDLKGDVSISRIKEVEESQIQSMLSLIKKEVSSHKTEEQILSDLTQKGYDPELILKILEHPLFNKNEAKLVISQIIKEILFISKYVKTPHKNEVLIKFFKSKYQYSLLAQAFADKQLSTNVLARAIAQVINWVLLALKKGCSAQQITNELVKRNWNILVVNAIYEYCTFVIASEHHIDIVIEKDYIELDE